MSSDGRRIYRSAIEILVGTRNVMLRIVGGAFGLLVTLLILYFLAGMGYSSRSSNVLWLVFVASYITPLIISTGRSFDLYKDRDTVSGLALARALGQGVPRHRWLPLELIHGYNHWSPASRWLTHEAQRLAKPLLGLVFAIFPPILMGAVVALIAEFVPELPGGDAFVTPAEGGIQTLPDDVNVPRDAVLWGIFLLPLWLEIIAEELRSRDRRRWRLDLEERIAKLIPRDLAAVEGRIAEERHRLSLLEKQAAGLRSGNARAVEEAIRALAEQPASLTLIRTEIDASSRRSFWQGTAVQIVTTIVAFVLGLLFPT